MTDMVKNFKGGAESLQQGMQAHGFRKGVEAINLTEVFLKRNIRFEPNDSFERNIRFDGSDEKK